MNAQLSLFQPAGVDLVPSPLCMYEHCSRKGMAELGPVRVIEAGVCENRSIRCLKCHATGEQSRNLLVKAGKRKAAA